MTELEALLTRALSEHAEQITPASLRRPSAAAPSIPASRAPRVVARVVLVAAAVVVVAGGTALVAVHGLPGDPAVTASRTAALPTTGEHRYLGRRWVVVAVESGGLRREVPTARQAVLAFDAGGALQVDDGVNVGSGSLELTASGFRVTTWGGTWAAGEGGDPATDAQLAALNRIEGVLIDGRRPRPTTVSWRGERLLLDNGPYRLELTEDRHCRSRFFIVCPTLSDGSS